MGLTLLPDLVAELEPVLRRVATAYELILVNDGSPGERDLLFSGYLLQSFVNLARKTDRSTDCIRYQDRFARSCFGAAVPNAWLHHRHS